MLANGVAKHRCVSSERAQPRPPLNMETLQRIQRSTVLECHMQTHTRRSLVQVDTHSRRPLRLYVLVEHYGHRQSHQCATRCSALVSRCQQMLLQQYFRMGATLILLQHSRAIQVTTWSVRPHLCVPSRLPGRRWTGFSKGRPLEVHRQCVPLPRAVPFRRNHIALSSSAKDGTTALRLCLHVTVAMLWNTQMRSFARESRLRCQHQPASGS